MSDGGASGRGGPPELNADECVRAGMYWFGRSDLTAAEAWWKRALLLDANHVRAQECLRLLPRTPPPSEAERVLPPIELEPLSKSVDIVIPQNESFLSSTGMVPGFSKAQTGHPPEEQDRIPDEVWNRVLAETAAAPVLGTESPRVTRALAVDLDVDVDAAAWALGRTASSSDPLDFASESAAEDDGDEPLAFAGSEESSSSESKPPTPWDDGPSRTSVVTLRRDVAEPDALAEHTPLPALENERFFGRATEQDSDIVGTFEEGVTDAPPAEDVRASPIAIAPASDPFAEVDIRIDEAVELQAVEGSGFLQSPQALLCEAKDRYQLHDFRGALDLLERIQATDAGYFEARGLIAESRANLAKMYESKIGPFDRSPHLLISSEELIWLNLDHRAGFILSQIDGCVTYEDIVSLSGMSRLDTLRILAELIQSRVIGAD